MSGPLSGLTAVDLTTVVMGPHATRIIKVEAPGGDNVRHAGPMKNRGMGHMFLHLNRNKKLRATSAATRWSRTPPEPQRGAPRLGEHGLEVLRTAGYSDAEIRDLAADGVTVAPV